MTRSTSTAGRPATSLLTATIIAACVVNVGFAIRYTNPAKGPDVHDLSARYGELHSRLAEIPRVAYFSDGAARFVGARYALAPVVLDIRYVDSEIGDRVIRRYDLGALVDDATAGPPVDVVGEFSDPHLLESFVRDLQRAASSRGVEVVVSWRRDDLVLLEVGD